VTLVEKPVELRTAPSDGDHDLCSERAGDPAQRPDRQRIDPSQLRARHDVLADIGCEADILLAPSRTEHPHHAAQFLIIHARRMALANSLSVTSGLTAGSWMRATGRNTRNCEVETRPEEA
jgi:hypothetical protein